MQRVKVQALIITHPRAHLEIFAQRAALEHATLAACIYDAGEVWIMGQLAQAIDADTRVRGRLFERQQHTVMDWNVRRRHDDTALQGLRRVSIQV